MKQIFSTTAEQEKQLHQIETMAIMLDKGCRAGEIDNDDVDDAQILLNKLAEELVGADNSLGSRAYIIYEAQALLHWVSKNEKEARVFVQNARDVKGDNHLFTITAKELLDVVTAEKYPKLVGLNGFLAWFIFGLVISVCYELYSSITGLLDTSLLSSEVTAAYPSLQTMISFENIGQLIAGLGGIYLIVKIIKKQKIAIRIAVVYFIFVLAYTLVDLSLANSMFNNNQAALDAISKQSSNYGRTIVYSIIWLFYFVSSKRVKATLTRELSMNAKAVSHGVDQTSSVVDTDIVEKSRDKDQISSELNTNMTKEPSRFAKQLETLESIAIKLDKGCRNGTIPVQISIDAQDYLNRVADEIIDSKSVGSGAYIVYEVQSLIHWVQNEEDASRKLAKSAATVKGNDILFTQTANLILRT